MRYLIFKVMENGHCRNPYEGSPRIWHTSFDLAKIEADRLCQKENMEFIILGEAARVSPAPKTVFKDCREE